MPLTARIPYVLAWGVCQSKLNDIIQLFIQNDKQNYLINIAISYKLTTEQIDKIKNNLNELNKAKLEHQL